jgi:homoserine kinase
MLIPEHGLKTAEARRVVPQHFCREDTIFNIRGAGILMAALATNQPENLSLAMKDRLRQPYRLSLMPGMIEIFEAALKTNSPGVALSGAASGIFAFGYPHNEKAISEAMKAALAQFGMDGYNLFLPFNINGVKIVNVF